MARLPRFSRSCPITDCRCRSPRRSCRPTWRPRPNPGIDGARYGERRYERTKEIAEIAVGIYPHAVLSGHAHLYERYTRTVTLDGLDHDVPFIICGSGGHHINAIARAKRGHQAEAPHFGIDVSYLDSEPAIDSKSLTLEKYNDSRCGYLRISADVTQLSIGYHNVGDVSIAQSRFDKVTVDISPKKMVSN